MTPTADAAARKAAHCLEQCAAICAGMTPAPGTPAHDQARANGARCRFAEVHRAWFAAREGRQPVAREEAWFDAGLLLGRDDWQQAENARVWSAEDWDAASGLITSGAAGGSIK